MPQLFPPEIINYSAESYYVRVGTNRQIIYCTVLIFLILIFILLPVIRVDISTQSRGVIRAPLENITIQSAVYAEIVRSDMSENKNIRKGDTLLLLNTGRLDEQIILETQKYEQNQAFIKDITNILAGRIELLTEKYRSEYNRYILKVKEQEIQIDYLEKEYTTSRQLYQKTVIPELEYLQQKNNWEKAMSLLQFQKEDYRTSWQAERSRLEIENQVFISNIKQIEKDKEQYIIIAPVTGSLVQVAGFRPGNFIAPNQPLAYISASDSLLAECYISPKDIGYIREGQEVSFQLDAFDYREWGLIHGNVMEILNDVVTVNDRPVFRVRCNINNPCLSLKNGYEGCVQKGSTLTGRFFLARRSLWQLLFDKVDNWMNPKIIIEE